ncbi:MAG TPA: FtsQ-type POTRA domain-containing protein [Solirubrobacter sp.]|nr:FtsQ-type POTRA domain-containing protein [Solirubrobacter sp.]
MLALGGAGWMWLRDSDLVEVRNVTITGATASDAPEVKAALESAALEMTTLNVRHDALRSVVASHPSVAAIDVATDFPHSMTIKVIERRPVATLAGNVPVTGDGIVLRGLSGDKDLPRLSVKDATVSSKLTDRRALGALTVAGAAPKALLERSGRVTIGPRGVVFQMRNGPELVFGSATDARAKWAAAARVLAETSAAGATYLDLRIPGRVAAGGLAPVEPEQPNPNLQPEAQNGLTLDQ